MTEKICGSCEHFHFRKLQVPGGESEVRVCRRYPPVWITNELQQRVRVIKPAVVKVGQPDTIQQPYFAAMIATQFPATHEDLVCGEWAHSLEREQETVERKLAAQTEGLAKA